MRVPVIKCIITNSFTVITNNNSIRKVTQCKCDKFTSVDLVPETLRMNSIEPNSVQSTSLEGILVRLKANTVWLIAQFIYICTN